MTSTITNNNIYDNSQYNFKLQQYASDVTVSNNWWGTTDTQAINQTIYDVKNDFNLGRVVFEPFLTSPNPEYTYTPGASPTSSPTPFPSPSEPSPPHASTPTASPPPAATPSHQSEMTPEQVNAIVGVVIVAVIFCSVLGFFIYFIRKK